MKLHGHTFTEPNKVHCCLPRGNGETIVFTAQAILSYEEFEKLCPVPTPPVVIKPGGVREPNYKDPTYMGQVAQHGERRMAWMILKSLSATEGLVWEKVDMRDPRTWVKFTDELKESFFSEIEIQRIQSAVFEANSLIESRLQEARENFLRGKEAEASLSSSLHTEQPSTPSGEPANALE